MLAVNNLSKSFGLQTVFDGVTFTVNRGERIGLVGRNGSGKTTLFKIILGQEEPDSGAVIVPKGYEVGHLSQHTAFTRPTVLEEACRDLRGDIDGTDRTYRVKAILQGLGFAEEQLGRSPRELSGGYQIRLNLARILASGPDLLLLDEPTNYLDIVSVRWLTRFLRQWRNEVILITHDRDFMDSVTTHTMAIHRCKIRKMAGSTHKMYDQILKEEEIHEQTRIHEEKRRKEIEDFIHRFRAQASRARAVQSRIRLLEKEDRKERLTVLRTLDFEFPAAPFPGKWLMEVRDLSFSYGPSEPFLMRGLTFAVGKRDRIGVIGKNGRGKTTLLALLAGVLSPTGGTVRGGEHLRTGYFSAGSLEWLDPEKTVEEEISAGRSDLGRNSARNICGAMMFEGDNALKRIGVLSGGEKSRVLLGKLLVTPSNLLLLDEPTNHLDMESIDSLVEALDAFQGGVVIATHSELILHALADRLIVFDRNGVGLFEGTYRNFLDRVGWEDEELGEEPQEREEKRPRPSAGRKNTKRLRAAIITNRSRVLNPLKERMAEVEERIMRLEEQVKDDNEALLRASRHNDSRSIVTLSVSIHKAKELIETSFAELDALTAEHHRKNLEFERMLGELDAGDR